MPSMELRKLRRVTGPPPHLRDRVARRQLAGYIRHMARPAREIEEALSLLHLPESRRARAAASHEGGKGTLPSVVEPGDTGWVAVSREGVPADALAVLASALGLSSPSELATELGVARRTVQRRLAKKQTLPFEESEKSVRVARALVKARHVFEDEESGRRWLVTPSKALGGARPLSLLETADGFTLVMDELGRIDYGVYS